MTTLKLNVVTCDGVKLDPFGLDRSGFAVDNSGVIRKAHNHTATEGLILVAPQDGYEIILVDGKYKAVKKPTEQEFVVIKFPKPANWHHTYGFRSLNYRDTNYGHQHIHEGDKGISVEIVKETV